MSTRTHSSPRRRARPPPNRRSSGRCTTSCCPTRTRSRCATWCATPRSERCPPVRTARRGGERGRRRTGEVLGDVRRPAVPPGRARGARPGALRRDRNDVHPYAQLAAEASEAAAEQEKFWEMYDVLLSHQDALAVRDLVRYA